MIISNSGGLIIKNPTRNELILLDRVKLLESIIFTEDNIETAKALSKGAVAGTVNLLAEMSECKDLRDEEFTRIKQCLFELEAKFNYEITKIKTYINQYLR